MSAAAERDAEFMRRAIALAWRSAGHTRPNPPVGAVVVKDGRIIGEGRHKKCGGPHAETAALGACTESPRGATVYVTLEPCSRPGRVGACTEALVEAEVGRVVWACADPNPVNRGGAARVLRRAGVSTARGVCVDEAEELIRPFAKHVATGMPFVTVKLALSLDGRAHDDAGNAKWISSATARAATGRLRERVDAVMVGGETVRRDDPSLLCHTRRNDDLLRVIVTRGGHLPKRAQVFTDGARDRTLVFRTSPKMDLRDVLSDLGRQGVMHLLCEGGPRIAAALAREGLVDEWLAVMVPCVIGSGPVGGAVRMRGDAPAVLSTSEIIWRCTPCSQD